LDDFNTVIFLHIPKTAGQTLDVILERHYPLSSIYTIYGFDIPISESVKRLSKFSENYKEKIKLIKGHYKFGLHQLLPQKTTYITLLRDPVDRIIAHYYYVLRQPSHYLNGIVKAKKMSLADYVSSGISKEMDNGQTRLLSGKEKQCDFGQCKDDLLKLAKDNLKEHFSVVGLTERFDESLILMSLKFGWRKIYYSRRNVSRKGQNKTTIGSETRRVIEKFSKLDLELYEYGKNIFEKSIRMHQSELSQPLRKLKRQNFFYQRSAALFLYASYPIRKLKRLISKP